MQYKYIFFFCKRYNQLMKLLLTILLGLLLVQAVVGLHLHAEEESAGNVTANAAGEKSEEDEQIQKSQKNYAAIEASGHEDLKKEAKEAREAFEAAAKEAKEKAEAIGSNLSEDATLQERLTALDSLAKIQHEFKNSLNELTNKLEGLKKKLDEKNAGSQ